MHGLNNAQMEAVMSNHPRILCIAGAGTGKTHTLTSRLVRLYEDGILPKNMLCLTFTRAAGAEMKERAIKKIGPQAQDIFCNTFHAFAAKILRLYAPSIGYTPLFSIYDEEDRDSVVASILAEYQYRERLPEVIKAMKAYYMYGTPPIGEMKNIINEYEYRLKRSNAFDFDGLLHNLKKLLYREDVRQYIHDTYTHIFVDEFQDSDARQMAILKMINPENLFAVGDDFQSIFGFSGADVSIIMGLAKDPEWQVIKLEENYRSTIEIVDAANSLIRHNKQTEKVLKAHRSGMPVRKAEWFTPEEEAAVIAEEINIMSYEEGLELREFAVLCRTNRQASFLAEKIEAQGLKTELKGQSIDKLFSSDAKAIFAWMTAIVNPLDDEAVTKAMAFMGYKLDRKTGMKVDLYQLQHNASLLWALRELDMSHEFLTIYDELSNGTEWLDAGPLFGTIVARLTREKGYAEAGLYNRLDALHEVGIAIDKWSDNTIKEGEEATPKAWLEYYKLLRLNGELQEAHPEDAVQVMTAHKSKGLEWPVVFVTGSYNGSFPMKRGDLEEERRLYYVAMTRAKDRLILTRPEHKEGWNGQLQPTEPSIFLEEIEKTT